MRSRSLVAAYRLLPAFLTLGAVITQFVRPITIQVVATWLIFPLVYVIYSLIRGPYVDWYPYPFLDPRAGGYDGVAAYAAGIAIAMGIICLLVRAASGSVREP